MGFLCFFYFLFVLSFLCFFEGMCFGQVDFRSLENQILPVGALETPYLTLNSISLSPFSRL